MNSKKTEKSPIGLRSVGLIVSLFFTGNKNLFRFCTGQQMCSDML